MLLSPRLNFFTFVSSQVLSYERSMANSIPTNNAHAKLLLVILSKNAAITIALDSI